MTTELESGVGNCFPGLEVDLRNLDRRFFPYLAFDFLGDQVIELVGTSLARAQAEQPPGPLVDGIRRLATEQGTWRVTRVTGDFAGFGSRTFQTNELGESDGVPPDGWTVVRLLRPATQVTLELRRTGGPPVAVTATRASYLTDDGAFAEMFEPGELTQSLCSPWTHDFRDCGCFYWASNHPDLTLPALPAGVANNDPDWGMRTLWLRSDRAGNDPPDPAPPAGTGAFRRPGAEMDYFEINQRWQDLDVVLDGRELRVPYDPDAIAGVPLAPAQLLPTLRYAAGVEVAVMLEYLAALYSLDVNAGAQGTVLRDDVRAARQQLLLVAISEMRHLRWVNSVLFELHRRSGGAAPFTPALGVATILRGSAGFADRPVRFRRLTPDVMAEFVRVEAPSLTVDGLYSSLLATFERDGDDDLAASIRSVMADGAEHYAVLPRHPGVARPPRPGPVPASPPARTRRRPRAAHAPAAVRAGARQPVPGLPARRPQRHEQDQHRPPDDARVPGPRRRLRGPGPAGIAAGVRRPGRPPVRRRAAASVTVVLGSGAVALAHALFQARYGPVVLAARPVAAMPAVERVPAPLLTLLLELGIVPAELDVDRLTRDSLVAWEQVAPMARRGPACAHVDRSALVGALWRRVQACRNVEVVPPLRSQDLAATERFVDATGRRALTAVHRVHPTPVWMATACTIPREDLDPTMRLAAGPNGYAFRLGSARWLTVGWVGPGAPPPDSAAVCDRLVDGGAGWLLEDVDLADAEVVRRVASVAVTAASDDARVLALGDAALGRDALGVAGHGDRVVRRPPRSRADWYQRRPAPPPPRRPRPPPPPPRRHARRLPPPPGASLDGVPPLGRRAPRAGPGYTGLTQP